MKRCRKSLLRLGLMTGALTAAFAVPAMADDEDREKIDDITIDFSYDTDDDEVYVDVAGDGVQLEDFDAYGSGNSPKVKVYLEAEDGYYFSSKSSRIFDLNGEGAKLSGTPSIKNDKTEMVVTVVLDDIEGWNDIDEAYWSEDSAIAHWTDTGSSHYQVRLYRNGSAETSAITVRDNVYNFNGSITKAGRYSFKVRVDSGDEWTESEDLDVDADEVSHYLSQSHEQPTTSGGPATAAGQWYQTGNSWWYRNADGSYTTNNWQYINNAWYHFDSAGWMQTGWIFANNAWYYLNPANGAMQTGWAFVNNSWYYLNPANGAMQTGWALVNNAWYYLNPVNGTMQTGWVFVNNKWYYLNASGAMLTNTWTPDNLYVGADGAWVQ